MKHKYWLEAVLLCGVMQSAPAQSILKNKGEKELSLLLNEVVVTGTGTEHYLKDAPVQTEVLTGKALEQYQARSIDDLLSGLSPSLTFHDGDMGSHIQLNGLNNDYILIMINGKRMNGGHRRTKRPQPTESRQHRAHRNRERPLLHFTAAMPLPESSISLPNGAERKWNSPAPPVWASMAMYGKAPASASTTAN